MLAFLESDGELINSAPAKRSQSLSVGSTSSDAAVEDAAEDAMLSESRRSHAEFGDCGLDSSVAHEEAAMPGANHREGKHRARALNARLPDELVLGSSWAYLVIPRRSLWKGGSNM